MLVYAQLCHLPAIGVSSRQVCIKNGTIATHTSSIFGWLLDIEFALRNVVMNGKLDVRTNCKIVPAACTKYVNNNLGNVTYFFSLYFLLWDVATATQRNLKHNMQIHRSVKHKAQTHSSPID